MKREGYWDGALWAYHADITNDGSNSGNHLYSLVPGAGNELEFLQGTLFNGDAVGRTGLAIIHDAAGGNVLHTLRSVSIAATDFLDLPNLSSGSNASGMSNRIFVAGTMDLLFQVNAMAVSKESRCGIVCRIRGGLPTVTLTSPADAVEVVNMNQVY